MSISTRTYRLLIVDDSANIHEDFRKVLLRSSTAKVVTDLESELFGDSSEAAPARIGFEIDSAFQGEEGIARVRTACAAGRPYALAFVDVRMPPGIDGITAIARIWAIDPGVQVVICSAYSDYSWAEINAKLGQTDRLVILRKPFDNIEVLQLAHALTEKWNLHQRDGGRLEQLEKLVGERSRCLRESQEAFQLILKHTGELVALLDDRGCYIDTSVSHGTFLGFTSVELSGRSVLERIHPDDAGGVQSRLDRLHVDGPGCGDALVFRLRHRDDAWRRVEFRFDAVRDAAGKFVQYVAVGRDISAR